MTLEQIKEAVQAGKTVCWKNDGYRVICDKHDQWFIFCRWNSDCIGLTHRDGVTMNGKPEQFYILESEVD